MNFRLLTTGYKTAAENMAIDEAVLEQIAAGASAPTLRLYGWSPPAVSIGYFQSLEEEVDVQACRADGFDIVRRMTGGGAVFHEQEITYSMHIPESSGLVPAGILESYGKICDGILKGLAHLGLQAKFVPLNDIVLPTSERTARAALSGAAGGDNAAYAHRTSENLALPVRAQSEHTIDAAVPFKKVSGNAQTRKRGIILQHGTILLKVDVDKMFSLLKVPNEKLKGKLIEDVKQRVTGLGAALGREVGFEEALAALKKGFAETFPEATFEAGELSEPEKARAEELVKEKYGNDAWNRKR